MKDDIETLRQALGVLGLDWPIRANNAIDALDRVENDLKLTKSAAEDHDKDCTDMRYQRDAAIAERAAEWNAAIEVAAKVADRLVGEWHSDLADGCARQAASDIRSLKRLK